MPTKTRAELEAEKLAFVEKAREIATKADNEARMLTGEERTEITRLVTEAKSRHDEVKAIDGDAELRESLNVLGRPVGELATGPAAGPGRGVSLGEKFTNSPEFKNWLSSVAPGGMVPDSKGSRVGNSPPVAFGMKDVITGGSVTSAGALVTPDQLGLLDGLGQFQRPLTIVDLITRGTTGTDTVEYARVTGFTNAAATVPEATTAGAIPDPDADNTAGLKPESAMLLEKKTAVVKTIAHWLPATKRALSDAAQIRTLIDNFLRYGLEEELEDQVLTGNSVGEDFEGILNTPNTQVQAFDTDLLVTTRKARTLVRTVGRARPTAFVFHPNDNEAIDLLRDLNGQFYFGGPSSAPSAPLWGLPRVESEAMPEGTGMVADWRMAVLWDREQAAIQVSDSHADFFVRNLVAILAEMRAAFGVIRPKAFVEIDLAAGS
jgi:HK97 family phage major capsid protein